MDSFADLVRACKHAHGYLLCRALFICEGFEAMSVEPEITTEVDEQLRRAKLDFWGRCVPVYDAIAKMGFREVEQGWARLSVVGMLLMLLSLEDKLERASRKTDAIKLRQVSEVIIHHTADMPGCAGAWAQKFGAE